MIVRPNGTKYYTYFVWNKTKNEPYKYEMYGILPKIMSANVVNTDNTALKYILSFFEKSIIFLLKYVDELKNFKNIHWKNR